VEQGQPRRNGGQGEAKHPSYSNTIASSPNQHAGQLPPFGKPCSQLASSTSDTVRPPSEDRSTSTLPPPRPSVRRSVTPDSPQRTSPLESAPESQPTPTGIPSTTIVPVKPDAGFPEASVAAMTSWPLQPTSPHGTSHAGKLAITTTNTATSPARPAAARTHAAQLSPPTASPAIPPGSGVVEGIANHPVSKARGLRPIGIRKCGTPVYGREVVSLVAIARRAIVRAT